MFLRARAANRCHPWVGASLTLGGATPAQVHFGVPHAEGGPPFAASTYTFEPSSLHLAPGASGQVVASFAPRDSRDYAAAVPIYLGAAPPQQQGPSRPGSSAAGSMPGTVGAAAPYMHMELQGVSRFASLAFDVRECVLPPVPLGESHRCSTTPVLYNLARSDSMAERASPVCVASNR